MSKQTDVPAALTSYMTRLQTYRYMLDITSLTFCSNLMLQHIPDTNACELMYVCCSAVCIARVLALTMQLTESPPPCSRSAKEYHKTQARCASAADQHHIQLFKDHAFACIGPVRALALCNGQQGCKSGLPIFECQAVASNFEQRHQLLTCHRYQTQAGEQCGFKTCPTDTAASLQSPCVGVTVLHQVSDNMHCIKTLCYTKCQTICIVLRQESTVVLLTSSTGRHRQ